MNIIQQNRDTLSARQVAVSLIASHLSLWNGRPYDAVTAEEVLEDMQIFGTDEDAEHASDICEPLGIPMHMI
jgi:hypothetical protein